MLKAALCKAAAGSRTCGVGSWRATFFSAGEVFPLPHAIPFGVAGGRRLPIFRPGRPRRSPTGALMSDLELCADRGPTREPASGNSAIQSRELCYKKPPVTC
jgi:hypothetical protein